VENEKLAANHDAFANSEITIWRFLPRAAGIFWELLLVNNELAFIFGNIICPASQNSKGNSQWNFHSHSFGNLVSS
jgi:hypothetical protein